MKKGDESMRTIERRTWWILVFVVAILLILVLFYFQFYYGFAGTITARSGDRGGDHSGGGSGSNTGGAPGDGSSGGGSTGGGASTSQTPPSSGGSGGHFTDGDETLETTQTELEQNQLFQDSDCGISCRNSIVESREACDDGNAVKGDGCFFAKMESGWICLSGSAGSACASVCGDGQISSVEQCDDGNLNAEQVVDGCSATCTIDSGWSCAGEPSICYQSVTISSQCADHIDNDGDGYKDYPQDTDCSSLQDLSEFPACSDNEDSDADGWIDLVDPGCDDSTDTDELNDAFSECSDGIDNDNNGFVDGYDPSCTSPDDNSELAECSDNADNDGDGKIDYPADLECSDQFDISEEAGSSLSFECSDNIDNDGDSLIDYPNDPGCSSLEDISEQNSQLVTECNDDQDNDGDYLYDLDDAGCINANDNDENNCGDGLVNGYELCDETASPQFYEGSNECDPRFYNSGSLTCNGCSTDSGQCISPGCGDGVLDGANDEECDDDNSDIDDACNALCKLTYCGDGLVQSPNGEGVYEECDGWSELSPDRVCFNTCRSQPLTRLPGTLPGSIIYNIDFDKINTYAKIGVKVGDVVDIAFVDGEIHTATVLDITGDQILIEVASTPQEYTILKDEASIVGLEGTGKLAIKLDSVSGIPNYYTAYLTFAWISNAKAVAAASNAREVGNIVEQIVSTSPVASLRSAKKTSHSVIYTGIILVLAICLIAWIIVQRKTRAIARH